MKDKQEVQETFDRFIFNLRKKFINEGIEYDSEANEFKFDNDSEKSIVRLKNGGLVQSSISNKIFLYKYEFEHDVDSRIRTEFIHQFKFAPKLLSKQIHMLIKHSIDSLDDVVSLRNFGIIAYPKSLSNINREVLAYIRGYKKYHFIPFELIKIPTNEIEFDYDAYVNDALDAVYEKNGSIFPKYTEEQKRNELRKITDMMSKINNSDYFSIGRDLKIKYRNYINNIYKFSSDEEKESFALLSKTEKVLLIDDVATSGATLKHLIDSILSINNNSEIVVFSLFGREL